MHERDLFMAAIEIDDETARQAYLDEACVGDPGLRTRVERLLNRAGEAGDFLEQPAADLCSDWNAELLAETDEPEPAGDPEPAGGDPPTMIGKADDTGQTVVLSKTAAAVQASSSIVADPSQSGLNKEEAVFGTLFGRYRVERVLGSGGMGVVYLAEDLRLGRRVALKVPKFDADGKFQLGERFRREARTMASVLHRNLCPIFDVDEQDGTHYLTMAFIDGESLSQILKQSDRDPSSRSRETSDRTLTSSATSSFTTKQIAELIRKLALALDEAHRAGVVHRDLKPANVMIDRSGEPILMDFGLAWMAHESDARLTQSGAIVGTPAYMSPEQAAGDADKVGTLSDIYSLGAMLYELLTGRPIYTGGMTRVLFKLIHETPTRPSEIRGGVDPQLEAICLRAIARRPEDRFATAADFADALATFENSEGDPPRRTAELRLSAVRRGGSPSQRVVVSDKTEFLPQDAGNDTIAYSKPSPIQRNKSRVVLASLLLIGVLGTVWAIVFNRSQQTREELVPKGASKQIVQPDKSPPPETQPTNIAAAPVLPPALNPADFELTIHDPQWKLIQVLRPEGKLFSTRFDREGRLYFTLPERLGDKPSLAPGIYRVQPDGTYQPLVQAGDWEFVFTPDEQRCFTHRGTMGMIAEVDLKTGLTIRTVDMSPSDDSPTSPYFAPAWYRGTLVRPNEYLFADFGGTKRGPPSTGGLWKFGSDMVAPERLLAMPAGGSLVHALAFGRDQVFVATVKGSSGSLATFDGRQLVERPTETLPPIGNLLFDPSDGSLLASELNGHAVLRIDLSKPDQPASVKPILSGFQKLNFGVLSLSADRQRMAIVDFDANTIFVLMRTLYDAPAAPLKLEVGAALRSATQTTGLKLGDLDGDGDLDLFVAMLKTPCLVFRNDGKGGFTDSGQQLGNNASFAVALGDLDGDGDLDAFVCNSDDQEDAIWLNDGRGMFQRSPQTFPPSSSNDVALADVDGDKDLDVVVSNWKGSVEIWINDGTGKFANRQTISRIGNTGVALGDLDGDGDADLVMTSIRGDNRVWLNDGQGHFTDSEQSLELDESTSVAIGDLDRDGDLDLFLTGNHGNRIWFNDSHGRFQASEQRLGDGKCEAVELVDLDADHDLDAVTIAGGWSGLQSRMVWLNDGQGHFQKGPALATGNSQSLAIGDLDGDGDADIVFGNLDQPAEVWLNQSNQSTIP